MRHRAFSLVEVVLALGIISFAIVGIMGLFPAAMKSALESQRETRATLIARQIFSDLKSFSGANAFVAKSSNLFAQRAIVNLKADSSVTVNFTAEGVPTTAAQNVAYTADISVRANQPQAGLSEVQASVKPIFAGNVPPYVFVTVLDQ